MKKIDFTDAVVNGQLFYDTAILLEKEYDLQNPKKAQLEYCVPTIVNFAMAIEITIKAVLIKNDIYFAKTHNLEELFVLLPELCRVIIISSLLRIYNTTDEDMLLYRIYEISNAFTDWRYCVLNNKDLRIDYGFLRSFAKIVCETIVAAEFEMDRMNEKKPLE